MEKNKIILKFDSDDAMFISRIKRQWEENKLIVMSEGIKILVVNAENNTIQEF